MSTEPAEYFCCHWPLTMTKQIIKFIILHAIISVSVYTIILLCSHIKWNFVLLKGYFMSQEP